MKSKFQREKVKETFQEYPVSFRKKLMTIRELIFKVAKNNPAIDGLIETLKWGQPSYIPAEKNIGSPIRIHWLKTKPHQYGVYFNCNTDLIKKIKRAFPGQFSFEGKRALIFKLEDKLPLKELEECITLALTYHLKKKASSKKRRPKN